MSTSTLSVRVLVLAAYLMAAILPVLSTSWGLPQSSGQHAQMMASAGHTMSMETAEQSDDSRMLLCQQHCLLAAATLPAQVPEVTNSVGTSDLVFTAYLVVMSLSTPPPGPPPKVAVI